MSTLFEHYKLEDGKEWAILADGGSDYENIQAYVCVPAVDLNKPAEELGKTVASLRLAAEATRLKCAWLHSMSPQADSVSLLEIINRNLEAAGEFSKTGADGLLEATPQQTAFPNSIKPWPGDDAQAQVFRMMEWHPMIGLKVMLDMKQEIENKLREEYFDLLRLRESHPKKRLTPAKASRLAPGDKSIARLRTVRADRRQPYGRVPRNEDQARLIQQKGPSEDDLTTLPRSQPNSPVKLSVQKDPVLPRHRVDGIPALRFSKVTWR